MQETQEMQVQSPNWEDPLEKEMATHSSILAWRIPWTEGPGGIQSTESQSSTRLSKTECTRVHTHTHTHTRTKWYIRNSKSNCSLLLHILVHDRSLEHVSCHQNRRRQLLHWAVYQGIGGDTASSLQILLLGFFSHLLFLLFDFSLSFLQNNTINQCHCWFIVVVHLK